MGLTPRRYRDYLLNRLPGSNKRGANYRLTNSLMQPLIQNTFRLAYIKQKALSPSGNKALKGYCG